MLHEGYVFGRGPARAACRAAPGLACLLRTDKGIGRASGFVADTDSGHFGKSAVRKPDHAAIAIGFIGQLYTLSYPVPVIWLSCRVPVNGEVRVPVQHFPPKANVGHGKEIAECVKADEDAGFAVALA